MAEKGNLKVGDNVIITNMNGNYKSGEVGITFVITEINDNGTLWPITGIINGLPGCLHYSEVELVDKPTSYIGFWVHGERARSLEQVERYLTGDSHDQSKVQWFDGVTFYSIGKKEFPTEITVGVNVNDLIQEENNGN